MKKELEQFAARAVEQTKNTLIQRAETINGVTVVKAVLPLDPAQAKDLVFKIRESIPQNLLCVIGSQAHEKPMISIMLSEDMVKERGLNAGQIIREAAQLIQGGGGGQPHYAQAGGKNIDGLHAAVDKVIELANL